MTVYKHFASWNIVFALQLSVQATIHAARHQFQRSSIEPRPNCPTPSLHRAPDLSQPFFCLDMIWSHRHQPGMRPPNRYPMPLAPRPTRRAPQPNISVHAFLPNRYDLTLRCPQLAPRIFCGVSHFLRYFTRSRTFIRLE